MVVCAGVYAATWSVQSRHVSCVPDPGAMSVLRGAQSSSMAWWQVLEGLADEEGHLGYASLCSGSDLARFATEALLQAVEASTSSHSKTDRWL